MHLPPDDDANTPVHETVRRGLDRWLIGAFVFALVFVAVAVVKPWGSAPAPRPTSGVAPVAVEGLAASPAPAVTDPVASPLDSEPCGGGRLVVTPPGGVLRPVVPSLPVPAAGKVAYIVADGRPNTPDDRRVVVVGDAGGSRVVALVTSSSTDGVGNGWAEVRGWSADGSMLLVEVGRRLPLPDQTLGSCSDLFLVRTDASEVDGVTNNGPGTRAVGGWFVDGDRALVFARSVASIVATKTGDLVEYDLTLRVMRLDATENRTRAQCSLISTSMLSPSRLLAVSPDGSHAALVCDEGVRLVDVTSGDSILALGPASGFRSGLAWTSDGRQVDSFARSRSFGPAGLTIERAEVASGATAVVRSPVTDWTVLTGVAAFSPDGTRLLAEACADPAPGGCRQEFDVVDVGTGRSHAVYRAPSPAARLDARWLPNGREIAIGEDGVPGSIVYAADGSGVVRGSALPVDASWWSPPASQGSLRAPSVAPSPADPLSNAPPF